MTMLTPQRQFAQRFYRFRRQLALLSDESGRSWLDVDLTMAQVRALSVIASEGTMNGRSLAQALGIGPPAVSKLADHLVERGLVARREDVDDRRVVWLQATEDGRALLDRLSLSYLDGLRKVVASLDAEELAVVTEAWRILDGATQRLLAERSAAPTEPVETAVH